VTVTTTSGPAVLATQRVQYYQSFNEVASMAQSAASQVLYMPWYDRSSSPGFLNDNVHVVNPARSGSVTVTVSIPGCGPAPQQVAAGQESIFSCPSGQGFGGPVVVRSAGSVLASQRVQYYQTFNESLASS